MRASTVLTQTNGGCSALQKGNWAAVAEYFGYFQAGLGLKTSNTSYIRLPPFLPVGIYVSWFLLHYNKWLKGS